MLCIRLALPAGATAFDTKGLGGAKCSCSNTGRGANATGGEPATRKHRPPNGSPLLQAVELSMQASAEEAGRRAAQQAIDKAALRDGIEASLAAAQGEGGLGPVAQQQLDAQQFWVEFSQQRRQARRRFSVTPARRRFIAVQRARPNNQNKTGWFRGWGHFCKPLLARVNVISKPHFTMKCTRRATTPIC